MKATTTLELDLKDIEMAVKHWIENVKKISTSSNLDFYYNGYKINNDLKIVVDINSDVHEKISSEKRNIRPPEPPPVIIKDGEKPRKPFNYNS